MLTVQVRDARSDDAEAMVRVLNPIIAAGSFTVIAGPLTVQQQREFIDSFSPRGVFHVAERMEDQSVVALQDVAPFADSWTHAFDHVGVISTFVELSLRRQGVGRQLFAATLEAAKSKGFEKLFTYIRADNHPAQAAYRQQGFEVVGTARRHARLDGKYIDEIIVERFL